MKKLLISPFIFFLISANSQLLSETTAYIPEVSRITNQSITQANEILRSTQKNQDLVIPKDWKLVSVIPVTGRTSTELEYVLFFQDAKSNVHSFSIASNGIVSGRNQVKIKANE
jgi:hypothetical protein